MPQFDVTVVGELNLDLILSGRYKSKTGLGRGLIGTKALLDEMTIESRLGEGTTIRGWKQARQRWR